MPSACVWLDRQFRTVMSEDGLKPAMLGFMKNIVVVVAASTVMSSTVAFLAPCPPVLPMTPAHSAAVGGDS